jgi:hypothetical protein
MNLRAAENELGSRPPKVKISEILLEMGLVFALSFALVGLLG